MQGPSIGKAAIITGAARRVGRALAIFLAAKHGYDIVAHYNTSHCDALSLQETVHQYGRSCIITQADLRDHSSLEPLIEHAFNSFPHCNVLINNASVFRANDFAHCTSTDLDENFLLHLQCPLLLTQSFARKCNIGKVVNMIDAGITRQRTKYFPYLLSKRALADFTKLAAPELFPAVCINAVCPTIIPDHEVDDMDSLKKLDWGPKLKGLLDIVESLVNFDSSRSGEVLFMDD
ncbi:SDR family NAD(P)-dependent oxidoreductase [Candidatus Anaplasma sp. TIGMIC]|uniref:SDR family NAD(P)-dependent oxidoreductase n=1 Tax=Candidatus Anaplasma sp. TIGMIC TaxID=3020713 RepID=UPI00232D0298|nr:SDR family NAD(P)-dependent oxidoreductase [Candidatus Anaplasma sp. TIGMIC]MDB1135789.1 SDR family NAD(P)-dependent oxidoreductase [Candidatus Anaplasma sp. TIGMIC]